MNPFHFFILISFNISRRTGILNQLYYHWNREICLRLASWAKENNFRVFPSAWGTDPPLIILDSRHIPNHINTAWYELFRKHVRKSCRFRSNFHWLRGRGFEGNCYELLQQNDSEEYHELLTSTPGMYCFLEHLNRFNMTYEDDLIINFSIELYVQKKAAPLPQKTGFPCMSLSA